MPEIKLEKRLPNLTPEEEAVFTEAIMEAYLRGKADAVKWIPTSERLPKLETYIYSADVLFYIPPENVYVGYVRFDTGTWKCKESREVFARDKVTHWMPLPEAPKGERT